MIYKIMDINALSDEDIKKYYPMLTEAKQNKLTTLNNNRERIIELCCEIIVRQALSEFCNAPEFSFSLLINRNGKSVVGNYSVDISVVNSGDYVACAVSDKQIGISMIPIVSFGFKDAQNLFSDSEIRAIFSDSVYPFSQIVNMTECREIKVMQRFALLNSLKEAHFQSTGRGIKSDMNKTTFEIYDNQIFCSDKNAAVLESYIDFEKQMAISLVERCKQ